MKTLEEKIREAAAGAGMTLTAVAQASGMTPQILNNKMKRGTLDPGELQAIANATGATYVPAEFIPRARLAGESVQDLQEALTACVAGADGPDHVYWYGMGRVANYLMQTAWTHNVGKKNYDMIFKIWEPDTLQGKKDMIAKKWRELRCFLLSQKFDEVIAFVLGTDVDGDPDENAYLIGALATPGEK